MKRRSKHEFEELIKKLNDDQFLAEYKARHDDYKTSFLPNMLGGFLVWCGNFVYGSNPSYLKFRAVEVIARVPYQSWASAAYTLLTIFYTDEKKAIDLTHSSKLGRHANDNETMHVVVISQIVKEEHKYVNWVKHTVIPICFAFFYFWMSYFLYIINKKLSYELNYLFESHAFAQYSLFLDRYGDRLKEKKVPGQFLSLYGRECDNQYELFRSIRNDEMVHRNESIEEIQRGVYTLESEGLKY